MATKTQAVDNREQALEILHKHREHIQALGVCRLGLFGSSVLRPYILREIEYVSST